MEHRTWITEALRLHFEEHLPRVVAGRRLGVPKSTCLWAVRALPEIRAFMVFACRHVGAGA